jgi:hypothetical protein
MFIQTAAVPGASPTLLVSYKDWGSFEEYSLTKLLTYYFEEYTFTYLLTYLVTYCMEQSPS